jgi:hypothetical protein
MKCAKWSTVIAIVWFASTFGVAHAADPSSMRPAEGRLSRLTNEQLIDQLVLTTNAQYSVRTNIIASAGPLGPGLLMEQDRALNAMEAREELVRRGAAAVPDLLKHLDDARRTKAKISPVSGGINYTAKLDQNSRTTRAKAGRLTVNSRRAMDSGVKDTWGFGRGFGDLGGAVGNGEYSVAVGDLCFEAIGRIVNRNYSASGYRPSGIILVNSPVMSDDLCKAVRKDWSGMTAEEHRASLTADVETPDYPGRAREGIRTLLRYYPDAAPAAFRKRLSMPVYDGTEIGDFVEKQLNSADPETRKRRADEAIAARGPAFRDGLLWYLFYYQYTRRPAGEILVQLFGDYTEDNPPAVNSVDVGDLGEFLLAAEQSDSAEISNEIWQNFVQYSRGHAETWTSSDHVAALAARTLAHKGHDAELIAFCKRRLSELRPSREFDYDSSVPRSLLARLVSSQPPPPVSPYTGW